MSDKPVLRVDWCSHEAAKFSVEHWHYSRTMPAGKNVYLGVWEDGQFIGAVIVGMGSGNSTNGTRYGLSKSHEIAELVRVALTVHASAVSRIVSVCIKKLKKQSPGIRLLISMADPKAGHVGGIYQAGGWVYTGVTKADVMYQVGGEYVHHRTATSKGSVKGLPSMPIPPKHRYLYPLDSAMREQIAPLAKPYPKRDSCAASKDSVVPGHQPGEGGATPTAALQEITRDDAE